MAHDNTKDIRHRGRRTDNGLWVHGHFYEGVESAFEPRIVRVIIQDGEFFHVDPFTVGRYSGKRDELGREIFQDDVIRVTQGLHYWKYVIDTSVEQLGNNLYALLIEDNVSTDDGKYTYKKRSFNRTSRKDIPGPAGCEVIGNIFDTPGLIRESVKNDRH